VRDTHFLIDSHHLEITGLCPGCQASSQHRSN
jgi:hypothetical protein